MVGWRAVWLLAGCLTVLIQAANAQPVGGRIFIQNGAAGAGTGPAGGFTQRIDGPGSGRGIAIMIGGPDGGIDVGASLLKACDINQDGVAAPDEVKVGLVNWFRQTDTDTNGALSGAELAATLKQSFPVPPPPPGLPQIPEEFALHNLLATTLMASVDANKDGWLTFKEAVAFVGQSLSQWDSDGSGSLDASEFAGAFAQVMPPPGEVFERRR